MAEQTTTMIISPSYGQFVFDAVLDAVHRREITVTSHPVQYGAEIADHSYIEPEEVSLEIGMSDAMSAVGEEGHSVNAHAQLVQMMEARELVTLVTRLGTYRDMLIVSMTTPDSVAVMNGIKAQIGFKHVDIVTAQVVLVQGKITSSKGGYAPRTTQTEDEPEAEDMDWNKSILTQVVDIITGISGASDKAKSAGLTMSWQDYKTLNEPFSWHDEDRKVTGIDGKILDARFFYAKTGDTCWWWGTDYVKTSDGWVEVKKGGGGSSDGSGAGRRGG